MIGFHLWFLRVFSQEKIAYHNDALVFNAPRERGMFLIIADPGVVEIRNSAEFDGIKQMPPIEEC